MGQPNEGLPLQNKKRPLRSETTPGQNMAHPALGDKLKIYLPPQHIKLGLINIFVKDMCKESKGSGYLRQTFPKISVDKKKERIFIGPQIKELFVDQNFCTKLNSTKRQAWKAF
jgi:hypothetical protein